MLPGACIAFLVSNDVENKDKENDALPAHILPKHALYLYACVPILNHQTSMAPIDERPTLLQQLMQARLYKMQ